MGPRAAPPAVHPASGAQEAKAALTAKRSADPGSAGPTPTDEERPARDVPPTRGPPSGGELTAQQLMEATSDAPPSYRALLTIPTFPRLVGSILLARTASTMVQLILVLFALERYGTPALAGAVTLLSVGPGLLLSPVAGALLDRHGRTRLMALDYLVAAAALALVVGLAWIDALPVLVLLVIVGIQSLTFPLSQTGARTLFPLIVPRSLWERANAIDSNLYVVSSIFGPAIAGAMVALWGSPFALGVTAVMHVAAAVSTVGVRDPLGVVAHGRLLSDALAGVVYVLRHPTLRGLAITVGIGNVANGLFFIGVPVLVLTTLNGDAALVGQLFALQGLTAAVSVLFFGRIGTEGRERRLLAASIFAVGLGCLLVAAWPALIVAALAMLVIGLATGPFDIVLFTVRQRRTDPAWLGRAFAVSMSLNFIGFPIGSAVGGALAGVSLQATFGAAFVLCTLAAALTFVVIPKR